MAEEGKNISQIAKETGQDRKTVRKYLEMDDFSPVPPLPTERKSILDPYKPLIDKWIKEDQNRWYKQRHTKYRIYTRLTENYGYTGSYETVQKYVKARGKEVKQTGTQELIWYPGEAQVDFGEADFIEDTETVRLKYLVVSFPYSNDSFVQVFRGETAECVCQGLKDIFAFIGGTPIKVVFDNATGIGRRICDEVHETDLFKRFHAHYKLRVMFCNPYSGYEKGNVESKVGYTRRNLFVPPLHFHDIEELNRDLLPMHRKKAQELHYKKGIRICDLFKEDQAAFRDLPAREFDVVKYDWVQADGYGKVRTDKKHFYSTRPENNNQKVLVGKRAHYVDILNRDGTLLVRHRRQYGDVRTDTNDYTTSIAMLSHNAGAWENSGLRTILPDPLRGYLDDLEKKQLKAQLVLMSELNEEFGYDAAVDAMCRALDHGSIQASDAKVIAQRISGYGIDTPPDPGPSLKAYDEAFLPQEGGEAQC